MGVHPTARRARPGGFLRAEQILQVLIFQALAGAIVALAWAPGGALAAASAAVGAAIAVVANGVLVACVIRSRRHPDPGRLLLAFYVGEMGKLLASAVLFAAAFIWLPVLPVPVMTGFIVALLVHWVALLWLKPTHRNNHRPGHR